MIDEIKDSGVKDYIDKISGNDSQKKEKTSFLIQNGISFQKYLIKKVENSVLAELIKDIDSKTSPLVSNSRWMMIPSMIDNLTIRLMKNYIDYNLYTDCTNKEEMLKHLEELMAIFQRDFKRDILTYCMGWDKKRFEDENNKR